MNVGAIEKSTGIHKKITTKNEKGDLSKEDVERFGQEAEILKAENETFRERIEAKNKLDAYIAKMKESLLDQKLN